MSFDEEMAVLTQKYMKEVRGEELTIEQILQRPRWKRVYFWWKALEHYEGRPFPKMSIEQIQSIYGEE